MDNPRLEAAEARPYAGGQRAVVVFSVVSQDEEYICLERLDKLLAQMEPLVEGLGARPSGEDACRLPRGFCILPCVRHALIVFCVG